MWADDYRRYLGMNSPTGGGVDAGGGTSDPYLADWMKRRDKMLQGSVQASMSPITPPARDFSGQNDLSAGALSGTQNPGISVGSGINSSINKAPYSPMSVQASNPMAAQAPNAVQASNQGSIKQVQSGSGTSGDEFSDIPAGHFFSGYDPTNIYGLAFDPKQTAEAAREWADFKGVGGNGYARQMLGTFSDPSAMMMAMGIDPTKLTGTPSDKLLQEEKLYGRLSGQIQDRGQMLAPNPKNMLKNIFSAQYDPLGNTQSLAGTVANPNLEPAEQVSNALGLAMSALQGSISDQALQAWMATMSNFASDWQRKQSQTKTRDPNETFVSAVRKAFGDYGGLF